MLKRKLSKKQAKVWDRLKNGIEPPSPQKTSAFESFIADLLAESIRKKVDKEIIDVLAKQLNSNK